MRALIVEDNARLRHSLRLSLVDEGYVVDEAADGPDGQGLAEQQAYDVIVLDVLLPGKDGLAVCRDLRAHEVTTPILMLTARDAIEDRVRGLDSGADDYLVKPFALQELLARLRSLLRRDAPTKAGPLSVADLTLDPAAHNLVRGGEYIALTAKEFAILEFLMRHANQVIRREQLEDHVWSYDFEGMSNVVDVYIRRLRRKVDDPYELKLIETVRGVGYRLSDGSRARAGRSA
jgi:DNA-binding response OmpR family regulator